MTDIPEDAWSEAKAIARKAVWADGRGMIGRERNYLEDRVARAILADRAAQAERMARLEEARIAAHRNFIDAWEALPGGYYNVRDVDTWMLLTMKPAVERARRALSQEGSE